ncbi:MAG: hypothetical protein IJK06_02320 [Clostridia bacterium]|nr:hypothetical protein [Clostridia bacterium]
MIVVNRSLTVTLDGELLSFSGRMRLRGKDELSLFPALFTLELWNLPEEMYLRMSRCKDIAVSHGDACLVSGRVWDVFRHGDKEGTVTSVSISLGLDLWESTVSLCVPAGTLLSETVRQLLDASGTGIPFLSVLSTDPVSSRGQSFFGRASECVSEALMCHSERSEESPRPMLTPSGLMAVPPGVLPEAVRITEADLTDAPAFVGGSLHGAPSLMVLSATVAGWRPGQTVEVEYKNIRARGIVKERSVDADTGDGTWKSELLVEVTFHNGKHFSFSR